MSVLTIEGVVDHGQIRLNTDLSLPDNTKVYVVIPDIKAERTPHIYSPRLADPKQAEEFAMEVIEGATDADV